MTRRALSWSLRDGIAHVVIDVPGAEQNTLM